MLNIKYQRYETSISITCLLLLFAVSQLLAQTYKVVYEYDHAGNRISRIIITMNAQAKSMDADVSPLEQELVKCQIHVLSTDKRFLNMKISAGEENCCRFYVYSSSRTKVIR